MLTNQQMQQEFELFADVWKMFKALLPVSNKDDMQYWDTVNQMVMEIMRKYPGEFAQELSLAVLSELERRCKKNESQNTGYDAMR